MAYSPGRSGLPWARMRARVFAEETHCWICGWYVDQDLPRTHPMSRTVDHIVQLSVAPELALDRANCRLAHRRCNGRRAERPGQQRPKRWLSVDTSQL